MDYSSFSKTKLWMNIVCGVICYSLFVSELYSGIHGHSKYTGCLVFLYLAANCTFRVFSWGKLNGKKKGGVDEESFLKEEHRQGMRISIFSSATAVPVMLVFVVDSIIRNTSPLYTAFLVLCTVCFAVLSILNIRSLRQFNRL